MNLSRGFAAACLIMIGLPTGAQVVEYDGSATKDLCANEWANDFAMQDYCIQQNESGFGGFADLVANETDATMLRAYTNCLNEWLPDWTMANYCAGQQVDGRKTLPGVLAAVPDDVAVTISTKCEADWPDDFAMMAYCTDQQVSAWQSINN